MVFIYNQLYCFIHSNSTVKYTEAHQPEQPANYFYIVFNASRSTTQISYPLAGIIS